MDAEASGLCAIDEFGGTLIPVEILPCDVTRGKPADPQSIVELGKQLLECAKIGDTDTVRDLMCRGAPFTTDWLGTSALHFAAQNNHLETAEVLLRAGISRDARTKVDRTPLHMAAYEGHDQMAQLLLNYGAEVDSRDMLKMTPLHWAVEQEHVAVLLVLLEHGANPHAVCKFNRTPLTLALEHQKLDFVQLLQQEREIVHIEPEELQVSEMQEAEDNIMELEAERQREEQQRIELEQQQEKQRAKQQTANANKKQRMMYHRVVHPIVQTTYDETEQEREDLQRLEEKTIYLENNRSNQAFTNLTEIQHPNLQQFLKENGLTMIPVDNDATIVENAMESGHHVVLTEAGKLALNLTKTKPINVTPVKRLQLNPKKGNQKKVITIRADQILAQHPPPPQPPPQNTSRGPNILKRSSNNEIKRGGKIILTPIVTMTTATPTYNVATISSASTSGVKQNKKHQNVIPQRAEPVILRLEEETEDVFEISSEEEQIADIEELNRQLAEARREIEEYKKRLKKKEEEAELYKQQLHLLLSQRALN